MNAPRRNPFHFWLAVSFLVFGLPCWSADVVIVDTAAIKIEIVGGAPEAWTTIQPVDGGNGTFYVLYAGSLRDDDGLPVTAHLKLRFTPLNNFKLLKVDGNLVPPSNQTDPYLIPNYDVKADAAKELPSPAKASTKILKGAS